MFLIIKVLHGKDWVDSEHQETWFRLLYVLLDAPE